MVDLRDSEVRACAAYAPVVHLHDLFFGLNDESIVYPHLTCTSPESDSAILPLQLHLRAHARKTQPKIARIRTKLVFDDSQLLSMLLRQDAVHQSRLAGAQEACDDGNGHLGRNHCYDLQSQETTLAMRDALYSTSRNCCCETLAFRTALGMHTRSCQGGR